ncbi:hypothetical protein [Streptomyces cucumeris]|uniref:hypothetical protein n=1 Tax=Streptomyces cucumeris TaxID=2962890 RepID=UPI003D732E0F
METTVAEVRTTASARSTAHRLTRLPEGRGRRAAAWCAALPLTGAGVVVGRRHRRHHPGPPALRPRTARFLDLPDTDHRALLVTLDLRRVPESGDGSAQLSLGS